MKTLTYKLLVILILVASVPIKAQDYQSDQALLTQIVDRIVASTTYDFMDVKSGKTMMKIEARDISSSLRIRNDYARWNYSNGVMYLGILKLSELVNKPDYMAYVNANLQFAFKNAPVFETYWSDKYDRWSFPFAQLIDMKELDDCGSMGAVLIDIQKTEKNKLYDSYIHKAANHVLNVQSRLPDGTLVRHSSHGYTLWADDLYMSLSFLTRYFNNYNKNEWDAAIDQVLLFHQKLYDKNTGLSFHCWYSDVKENGVAFWGRANGWLLVAQAELLERLPPNNPRRDTLVALFRQQVLGISRYQSASGLWHQLLNKEDSYLETSSTALFVYAIAKGVRLGFLDPSFMSVAQVGWKGIKTKINANGDISSICIGTGIEDNLSFYYNRPTPINDIHGVGAVLLAGTEMLMNEKK